MKLLLLLLFIGAASSKSHEAFIEASSDVVENFILGMSQAPALHQTLGIQDSEELRRFERSIKDELTKFLREAFDNALKKIKEAVDSGKEIHKGALEKLYELKEKMKELNITEDEVAGKVLEELKAKVTSHLKEILEKMGIIDKRSIDFDFAMIDDDESIIGDLNIRNLIIRLKEMILEKMDVGTLKNSIAKFVGQGTEKLCSWLTEKGKEKVLNFFDRLLEDDEERKKRSERSVSDVYQQIKDYFHKLDLEITEKFSKFGEWVKNVIEKGLDQSKNKIQNVKVIAKQLLDKSKTISKEVAAEALEYLKEYKQELGDLYERVYNKLMEKILDYTD